jgi:glycosyltransferase involved in cell wall biosynthesis
MLSVSRADLASETCCVIPMYNEQEVIAEVIHGLKAVFQNILCVDDGSTDESVSKAREAGATVICHAVNIGQGAAIATGFIWIQTKTNFSRIVTFDADGQHLPEDAMRLVEELASKELDVVFASRFLDNQSQVPILKRLILRGVANATKALTDVELSDAHNGLRALTVDASRKIQLTQNGMAHATQFVSLVLQGGLKYSELPVTILYTPYSRSKGQSVLNSVNIVFDLIWG